MRHIIRDRLRSLLVILLIACAAVIAALGTTVHTFTLQQTKAVEGSVVTMAVRHAGCLTADARGARVTRYVKNDVEALLTLNSHESVRVPALTNAYAALNASVTPVYSCTLEDGMAYSWSHDAEMAHTVMTVTCLEAEGDPASQYWEVLVQVDEVHLPLPYDIPETIRVEGNRNLFLAWNGQTFESTFPPLEPLVPGESYLLCGRYEHYPLDIDTAASFANGYYDPVYVENTTTLPILRLEDWWNEDDYMHYIASPDDAQWREQAVRMGDMNNRILHLNCVNDLNRLQWFHDGTASIVEGRAFTEAEQQSGAKVCLVSLELAKANGLTIGDTISMTAYQPTITQTISESDGREVLTERYAYVNLVDLPGEDENDPRGEDVTLTIVGIYTAPLYKPTIDSIGPNTVYAPYGAVALPYNDYIRRLPIHTQNIIIHNGQGDAFLQAVRDAGYPDGTYTIEETNYPEVRKVLSSMAADSLTLLCISAAAGLTLFVVILYLYARSWQKENAILAMLGTTRLRVSLRMFGALAALTLLGCGLAFLAVWGAKAYIENALNAIYIGSSMDFSAVRVGAFSEEGMTIGVGSIGMAVGLTAGAFLLAAALQTIITTGKKVRDCLFD